MFVSCCLTRAYACWDLIVDGQLFMSGEGEERKGNEV